MLQKESKIEKYGFVIKQNVNMNSGMKKTKSVMLLKNMMLGLQEVDNCGESKGDKRCYLLVIQD